MSRLHVVRAGPKKAGKKLMLFVHGFPGVFSFFVQPLRLGEREQDEEEAVLYYHFYCRVHTIALSLVM